MANFLQTRASGCKRSANCKRCDRTNQLYTFALLALSGFFRLIIGIEEFDYRHRLLFLLFFIQFFSFVILPASQLNNICVVLFLSSPSFPTICVSYKNIFCLYRLCLFTDMVFIFQTHYTKQMLPPMIFWDVFVCGQHMKSVVHVVVFVFSLFFCECSLLILNSNIIYQPADELKRHWKEIMLMFGDKWQRFPCAFRCWESDQLSKTRLFPSSIDFGLFFVLFKWKPQLS